MILSADLGNSSAGKVVCRFAQGVALLSRQELLSSDLHAHASWYVPIML
jgi:hypothetical protein